MGTILEQWLMVMGALIFGVLGFAHLVFTFFTPRFDTRDPSVKAAMQGTSPRLTRDTTMWKAWVGFNASHSLGAMIFSIIYIYLGIFLFEVLQKSSFLMTLPVLVAGAYLILAKLYWFKIPFIGIAVAMICFVVALMLQLTL